MLNALKFYQIFNKNIISLGSVDTDPKTDPDPAKKGRIQIQGTGINISQAGFITSRQVLQAGL